MRITLPEFEASLQEVSFPLAVAVSGGADSLTLLLLAHELAQRRGSHVVALTVNHRLRPESKAEALRVAEWAKERSIHHVILEWVGEKPLSHIQEKARRARYGLLIDWCIRNEISTLLLGHHQQDQEETFWLRLSSGSGLDGLSGMKTRIMRNGIVFLRPLLAFSKDRIKETLLAKNQDWIEDPSNQNPQFFRGRLRRFFQDEGLSSSRLLQIMEKLQIDADFIQASLAEAIETSIQTHEGGYLTLKKHNFNDLHPAIAGRLVSFLVQWFSEKDYAPRSAQVKTILNKIKKEAPFTTGGIYWMFSQEEIFLFREQRAIKEKFYVSQLQGKTLWDQRFWVDPQLSQYVSKDVMIGPLGTVSNLNVIHVPAKAGNTATQNNYFIDSRLGGNDNREIAKGFSSSHTPIPKRAWPTLPALWEKGKVVAIPHLCYNGLECGEDLKKFIYLKPLFHHSLRIII